MKFLFVNALFKVFQCSDPDRMLWKLHQKTKSDCLEKMTCNNWILKM